MTTKTNITNGALTDEQIVAFEAKGFNRWIRGSMDRLYINVTDLGLEVSYYKTGNVSDAKWCGESISNADGRRFLSSKVFIDVKAGELVVQDNTTVDWHNFDLPTLEDKAVEYAKSVTASDAESVIERRNQLIESVRDFIESKKAELLAMDVSEAQKAKTLAQLDGLLDKAIRGIESTSARKLMNLTTDPQQLVMSFYGC